MAEWSHLDSVCVQQFLNHVSEELKGRFLILVWDGAPAHRAADLKVPENLRLVFLPPYSPELNPVERLWREVRRHTDGWWDDLDAYMERVFQIIQDIEDDDMISLTLFPYLRKLNIIDH